MKQRRRDDTSSHSMCHLTSFPLECLISARRLAHAEEIGTRLAASASPSELDPVKWRHLLTAAAYPDDALRLLMHAMTDGASIDPAGEAPILGGDIRLTNHLSLYGQAELVSSKLQQQRDAGTLVEWPRDSEPLVVSPLGTITKCPLLADEIRLDLWEKTQQSSLRGAQQRDAQANSSRTATTLAHLNAPRAPTGSGKVRIIHDARVGINDRADAPSLGKLDTLASVVHQSRPGDFMWVSDLRAAFKNVRIVPWQLGLMAFAFLGVTMVDTRLTFGLNLAPLLYHACVGHPLLWMIFYFFSFSIKKNSKGGCGSTWMITLERQPLPTAPPGSGASLDSRVIFWALQSRRTRISQSASASHSSEWWWTHLARPLRSHVRPKSWQRFGQSFGRPWTESGSPSTTWSLYADSLRTLEWQFAEPRCSHQSYGWLCMQPRLAVMSACSSTAA